MARESVKERFLQMQREELERDEFVEYDGPTEKDPPCARIEFERAVKRHKREFGRTQAYKDFHGGYDALWGLVLNVEEFPI